MTPIKQEIQLIKNDFSQIIDQVFFAMNDQDRVLIRQFIDQEEYKLALKGLAEITIRSDKSVTPALRNLFRAITDRMDMNRKDPDFSTSLDDILWAKHAG